MKKIIIILFLVVLSLPTLVSFTYERYVKLVPVFLGQAYRLEVNNLIEINISFYIQEYASKEKIPIEISKAIMLKALSSNIPVNLAFSLAKNESSYNPLAYNKNTDGSYDFGLFQLNSSSFGDVKNKYKDINKNTNVALAYLKELYVAYGSYDLALIAYNCGKVRRFNSKTQEHLKKILLKEEELDEWFNSKYRDAFSRSVG